MSDATVNQQRIALLGVPIEIGASQAGTLMGPAALRTAGIARLLEELEFAVEDHGDLARPNIVADGPPPANAKYYDEVKSWIRVLNEQAFAIARTGAIPIFMGGDHSLSMGSVNGVARHWQEMGRPLFVLWLDAHADYNTPQISPSGNMHGMPVAFFCGESGFDGILPADRPAGRARVRRCGIHQTLLPGGGRHEPSRGTPDRSHRRTAAGPDAQLANGPPVARHDAPLRPPRSSGAPRPA